jgi:hypothetical protein
MISRRWHLAALLWIAVLAAFEIERLAAPVRVFGPGGKAKLVPRIVAERLAARGRLRRAPDEVMRQELNLPPRITADVSSDHTRLAGME